MEMVRLSLLFIVLLVTTTYAQMGSDGTGTVNGYYIGPGADLSGADISSADLIGANLTNTFLHSANLGLANLSEANLIYANLTNTDLSGANFSDADLSFADLTGADLSGADLTNADLTGANLTRVTSGNITGTPTLPSGYQMVNGYIVGPSADLSGADLTNADLTGADLSGADLSGANLENAELGLANLRYTIWSNVISQSDYDAVVAERDAALTAQATAEAERDARPTQVAYDTVVAERDSKLTLDEIKDLRAGSTMIEIQEGQATLSMDIEKSSDLSNWTFDRATTVDIPIEDGIETQFFRFKMAE